MKYLSQLIALICMATLFTAAPQAAFGKKSSPSPATDAKATASASASPAAKTERAVPFRGMISAVDEKAKTFTISGKEASRTFKITDRSVLTKAGAAATMKDVTANEEVRGSYWKNADGSMEARTVKLGPLTEAEKAAREAQRAKRVAKKAAAGSPAASPQASATP